MAEPHIFEVELPNGEVIEVEAPPETSPEKIKARVNKFRFERAKISPEAPNPNAGSSMGRKIAEGIGASIDGTVQGIKQAGTSMASYFADSNPALFQQETRDGLRSTMASQQADEAERRRINSQMSTTGKVASVAGTVAQIVGPGGLAKLAMGTPRAMAALPASAGSGLSRLAATSLPTTIKGAAAQGAALGAAQPVVAGESRIANAGIGGLTGGTGAALGQGVGALVRGGARGVDRQVGNVLMREADDVSNIARLQQSQVQGVNRTLAEATRDSGLARVERQVRGTNNGFAARDAANNAARVAALRGIAGDDASMAAAREARDQAALSALERAKQVTGVDTGPLLTQVDGLIEKYTGNAPMQRALGEARSAIEASRGNMAFMENARQYIGKLISGQADGTNVKLPDLIDAKEALDGTMRNASSDFATYIDQFKAGSKPINRMQIGQELIGPRAGGKVLDATTGEQVLLPASFSGMARNLDDVAQRATGFNRARAADSLLPEDFATIRNVQDDLERQAFRGTAGSGGNSMTAERLSLGGRLAKDATRSSIARAIPGLGPALDHLEKIGAERLNERLAEVVLNPELAQQIMAQMPGPDRLLLQTALARIGATGGVAAVPILK